MNYPVWNLISGSFNSMAPKTSLSRALPAVEGLPDIAAEAEIAGPAGWFAGRHDDSSEAPHALIAKWVDRNYWIRRRNHAGFDRMHRMHSTVGGCDSGCGRADEGQLAGCRWIAAGSRYKLLTAKTGPDSSVI